MNGKHEIKEAIKKKILRLRHEGLSLAQLTERFRGITSATTIRKIIKKGNVTP